MNSNASPVRAVRSTRVAHASDPLWPELETARLLARVARTRAPLLKKALLDTICLKLRVQMQLDEEILCPALMRNAGRKRGALADEARQREYLRRLVGEVEGGEPDAEFDADVELLGAELRRRIALRHARIANLGSSRGDLRALGARLASRRQELLASVDRFGGWD